MVDLTDPTADPTSRPPLPDIIQRYLNGESIQDIAKDARVTRQCIYKWMHGIGDQTYYDLVTEAMIIRMANADDELENAREAVDIARARENAKFTRWDLERRRPAKFGLKQQHQVDKRVTVILRPDAPPTHLAKVHEAQQKQQVIEAEQVPCAIPPPNPVIEGS